MFASIISGIADRPKQHAGHAIQRVHSDALSKNDPRFKAVKQCFDQAARDVFAGHATAQAAGSASKGTGVQGRSDYDFFVRLTAAIPTVTQAQRMQFVHAAQKHMQQAGITYSHQPGQNRIWFHHGSWSGQPLPDVDVTFQSYKGDSSKHPPNNSAMASSPNGKEVVRYIKALPIKYTNAREPKSMFLEDLVRRVEQERVPQAARQQGRQGFEVLLRASLQAIADQQYKQILANAFMDNQEWQCVAQRVLKLQIAHGSW